MKKTYSIFTFFLAFAMIFSFNTSHSEANVDSSMSPYSSMPVVDDSKQLANHQHSTNKSVVTCLAGEISGELGPDITYDVCDTLIVPPGETLTIHPGTKFNFLDRWMTFVVYGTLNANGTLCDRVVFGLPNEGVWGGFRIADGATANFSYCDINRVYWVGIGNEVAMHHYFGVDSSTTFNHCRFWFFGHGPYDIADFIIEGDVVMRNSQLSTGHGAHVFKTLGEGSIHAEKTIFKKITAVNNVFIPYRAMFSGANQSLVNCTVANNESDYDYGGIFTWDAIFENAMDVRNSIVYFNDTLKLAEYEFGSFGTLNYSNVDTQGELYTCFYAGSGNIDEDPLFVSLTSLKLSADSPCINAGDPHPTYNDPDGTRNDMGAKFRHKKTKFDVAEIHPCSHRIEVEKETFDGEGIRLD